MPPNIALLVTLGFIAWLFRRDFREGPKATKASWLPFLWLLVACSREPTEWLQIWGLPTPGGSLEGGNPIDRFFYIGMIIAGLRVLLARGVSFGQLVRDNIALSLFLGYCLLSVAWSDYPFVSLKRWIKVLGHPVMAVILITEPNPHRALIAVMKRCSYILIPVSILFIKYYPHLGRAFSEWTGAAQNQGIAGDKNMLGINCLVLGVIYFWHILRTLREPKSKERKHELLLCCTFLYMNFWLLFVADSKTPLVCVLVAYGLILLCGKSWVRRGSITFYIAAIGGSIAILQSAFNVYEAVLKLLGRNPTLSERTIIWDALLKMNTNPFVGTGFESFWLGERMENVWVILNSRINQAHNGYLETYLNLGLIGLALLMLLLLATYIKGTRALRGDWDWGRVRLALVISIIIYNWTEAAFKTTHPVFFVLYIITLDYGRSVFVGQPESYAQRLEPEPIHEAQPWDGPVQDDPGLRHPRTLPA